MTRFRVYEHPEGVPQGKFDWQLLGGNNEILASSLQGYENLTDCVATVSLVAQTAADAPIEYDLLTADPGSDEIGSDEETSES